MLLALDIGNTQTSFGVFHEGKLLHHWRAETKKSRTEDEYAALLFPLLDHAGLKGTLWEAIIVCSVVPSVDRTFRVFCRNYLGKEVFGIHSDCSLGFEINVEVPAEVGADRLANSAYAVHNLRLPAVVVDIGTATTFDIVTADRVYQGGLILPGVRMGVEGLGAKTSLLPLVDLEFPPSVIGKSTADCIRAGILFGYCDLMDGILDRLERELSGIGEIVLTGGIAPLFSNRLRHSFRHLPDLTLEGACLIYERNRKI